VSTTLDVDFPAEIFDVQVNIPLIHQVVVAQQAAARQGTASTKTRGEVRGGGRKPYKQKGTGRARQGSTRAPQFAGGGVVHGPVPRSYEQRTPKKMKAAALRGALSDRARAGLVHVVDSFVTGDKPSTRSALTALGSLTDAGSGTERKRRDRRRNRILVVLERGDDLTWLSLRNVDTVHLLAVDQLNTYDVLLSDRVVFTKAAYDAFVGTGRSGEPATAEPAATEPAASTSAATEPAATEPATAEADETEEEAK
jgi:large subunit ribosomal protein L4